MSEGQQPIVSLSVSLSFGKNQEPFNLGFNIKIVLFFFFVNWLVCAGMSGISSHLNLWGRMSARSLSKFFVFSCSEASVRKSSSSRMLSAPLDSGEK